MRQLESALICRRSSEGTGVDVEYLPHHIREAATTLPLKLNRRHKVTLFLTLVLAGIAALSGVKMMEVAGISLLGLALAWAFGSDSRAVHWLFLSVGVLLACGTLGLFWLTHESEIDLYTSKVAAFEQRIPELAKKYPVPVKSGVDELSSYSSATGKLVTKSGLAFTVAKDNRSLIDTTPENSVRSGLGIDYKCYPDGSCVLSLHRRRQKTHMPRDDLTQIYAANKQQSQMAEDDQDLQRLASQKNAWEVVAMRPGLELPDSFVPDLPELTAEKLEKRHRIIQGLRASVGLCDPWTAYQENPPLHCVPEKLWDEARAAGLDLPVGPFDELQLPGDPPESLWRLICNDSSHYVLLSGVLLFALGLGLILGIRSKPLPT
jgi:hypothetical protein